MTKTTSPDTRAVRASLAHIFRKRWIGAASPTRRPEGRYIRASFRVLVYGLPEAAGVRFARFRDSRKTADGGCLPSGDPSYIVRLRCRRVAARRCMVAPPPRTWASNGGAGHPRQAARSRRTAPSIMPHDNPMSLRAESLSACSDRMVRQTLISLAAQAARVANSMTRSFPSGRGANGPLRPIDVLSAKVQLNRDGHHAGVRPSSEAAAQAARPLGMTIATWVKDNIRV
jgi:hypothetical protein